MFTLGSSRTAWAPAQRGARQVCRVAVPSKPPTSRLAKRSKVEIIKERSDFLRHPLMEELVNSDPFLTEDSLQLMKFHGSYQQDHREKRAFGQGKFYQFMMRTRQPSGLVTNRLYLVMDDLADKVPAAAGAAVVALARRAGGGSWFSCSAWICACTGVGKGQRGGRKWCMSLGLMLWAIEYSDGPCDGLPRCTSLPSQHFFPNALHTAVRQWHAAPDYSPGLPAPWCAQA
jgi:hypothetical protein